MCWILFVINLLTRKSKLWQIRITNFAQDNYKITNIQIPSYLSSAITLASNHQHKNKDTKKVVKEIQT